MTEHAPILLDEDKEKLAGLLKKAALGDEQAFTVLYDELFTPLYRFIYFRVNSKEEAEDLTQTVFVRAWQNLSTFEGTASFKSWLYTIARNAVIDHYRKKRSVAVDLDSMADYIASPDQSDREAIASEAGESVEKMLTVLSDDQREVVVLRFINELSTEEICSVMDKSADAIRQLQSRALKTLRERFPLHNPWNQN